MKVGIDISQIVYAGTGVGRFTKNLVESILTYDKENQYVFFFSGLRQKLVEDLERKILDKKYKLIKWNLPPTLLSFINNNIHSSLLSSIIYHLSSKLDWFITSDWTEPPLNVKKATIVHDLVYKRFPETLDKRIVSTQKKRMKWVKQESQIIFADSLTTKDDLIKYLDIEEKNIVVNYPGVTVTAPTNEQVQETLKKYQLKRPFILNVGKLEPRKNLERLVQSFERLNDRNIELVIVGPEGWDKTRKQFSNLTIKQSNIKFLGFIPDTDLYSLYCSCLFFIYPSIWEGFGYPIIEAMKLGSPVTCSNTSSMKEISGDAALLFDPLNTDEMFQCINTLKQKEQLRENLIIKGKKQSQHFTWKTYYDKFINALQR